MPLVDHPSESFLVAVEEDMIKLILKHGMMVILFSPPVLYVVCHYCVDVCHCHVGVCCMPSYYCLPLIFSNGASANLFIIERVTFQFC